MDVQKTTVPATPPVVQALKTASERTGTSFDYLVSTAYRESTFRPELKASTSSATGLFQFTEQPWLELVKEEGPAIGLGRAADLITRQPSGRYTVADPAQKQAILDLRNDPAVSSVMAGKATLRNAAELERSLGRTPSQQDLYVAHVLGATGGAKMIALAEKSPDAVVAPLFPAAAAANQPIFYNKDGSARTAREVHDFLARNHSVAPVSGTPVSVAGPAATSRVTPSALADILRAQAGARTETFGIGGSGATDMRASRTALGQTSLPGDASGSAAPTGGKLEGWRAGVPKNAFSALLRTDTAPGAGPGFQTGGALGYTDIAAGGTAGAAVSAIAGLSGADAGRTGARTAPQGLPGLGGPDAIRQTIAAGTLPTARPSRLVMTALANGAPVAPLPMVTSSLGVARPSRFSMAGLIQSGTDARLGTGATSTARVGPAGGVAPASTVTVKTTAIPVDTRSVPLDPISILPPGMTAPAVSAASPPAAATRLTTVGPVSASGTAAAATARSAAVSTADPTPAVAKPKRMVTGRPLDLTRMMPLR